MKDFFAFKNVDSEADAELSLHDEIGFWGTRAKDFHAALKSIKGKDLTVYINSPGGEVVAGYAIYNMLRASGKNITVVVQGIAASIASVIAMAGTKIRMPENALMFIHDPLVGMVGNAEDMKKMAADLDKLKDGILTIYEARTGSDRSKISKMMAEETLLTAKECKLLGFCDEVLPENKAAANRNFKWEDYHPSIKLPTVATPAPVGASNKQDDTTMTLEQAQTEIANLKATNSTLTTQVADAKKTATQEATNAVTTAENNRKSAIKAHAAKYNKDGDLNEEVINALSDSAVTVEQFKDKVTDIIAARGSKPALKKDGTAGADDSFEKRYEACKTSGERRALLRENRAEARKLALAR